MWFRETSFLLRKTDQYRTLLLRTTIVSIVPVSSAHNKPWHVWTAPMLPQPNATDPRCSPTPMLPYPPCSLTPHAAPCGEHVSVSVIFLSLQCCWIPPGAPCVTVDSMQMLFGRLVAGAQIPRYLGIHFEGMASEREVVTRILLKVWEWGEREGGRGKKEGREE